MSIPANNDQLLTRWHKRIREIQFSQYEAARILGIWHYFIGIMSILITAFVGSSVFSSLKSQQTDNFKLILGLIALLSTVLTSLQTFLKLSDRSEKHKLSGGKASILRRKIEQMIAAGDVNSLPAATINEIRIEYDKISTEAPDVSKFLYSRIEKQLENS